MRAAGKLNKRLTLLEPRTIRNEINEADTTHHAIAEVWGSVEPLNARELEQARSMGMQSTHRIKIDYTPLITSAHQLGYSSAGCGTPRVFHIDGLRNLDEANRELHITAHEVTTSG